MGNDNSNSKTIWNVTANWNMPQKLTANKGLSSQQLLKINSKEGDVLILGGQRMRDCFVYKPNNFKWKKYTQIGMFPQDIPLQSIVSHTVVDITLFHQKNHKNKKDIKYDKDNIYFLLLGGHIQGCFRGIYSISKTKIINWKEMSEMSIQCGRNTRCALVGKKSSLLICCGGRRMESFIEIYDLLNDKNIYWFKYKTKLPFSNIGTNIYLNTFFGFTYLGLKHIHKTYDKNNIIHEFFVFNHTQSFLIQFNESRFEYLDENDLLDKDESEEDNYSYKYKSNTQPREVILGLDEEEDDDVLAQQYMLQQQHTNGNNNNNNNNSNNYDSKINDENSNLDNLDRNKLEDEKGIFKYFRRSPNNIIKFYYNGFSCLLNNRRIFVFGGKLDNCIHQKIYEYDILLDKWESGHVYLSEPIGNTSSIISGNNTVHVISQTGHCRTSINKFDKSFQSNDKRIYRIVSYWVRKAKIKILLSNQWFNDLSKIVVDYIVWEPLFTY